jgi:uncharacterized damage-inducible protein DinB
MNEYFLKLYKGNYWANSQLCESVAHLYATDKYIAETFSHVINAQYIWFGRIKGTPSPYKVREIQPHETLGKSVKLISDQWLAYLSEATPAAISAIPIHLVSRSVARY